MTLTFMNILTAGVCSAGLIAGAALADDHGRRDGKGRPPVLLLLEAADANGDKTITRDEVTDFRAAMFAWRDRNGDGVLNIEDESPLRQFMAEKRAEAREAGEGANMAPEVDGPRGPRGRRGDGPRQRLDTDGDGAISLIEALAADAPVFEKFDVNGDGAITPDELDAVAAEREERRYWWRDAE